MKLLFVICVQRWTERSAGIRALHVLGKMLREAGESVCLSCPGPFDVPVVSKKLVDRFRGWGQPIVAIYPEGIGGNPMGADLVIRWLLNSPAKIDYRPDREYLPSDLLFHWHERFCCALPSTLLNVPVLDTDTFRDQGLPRTLACAYASKFRCAGLHPYLRDEIDLTPTFGPVAAGDKQHLATVLNTSRYLLLYEESALALEAALCGCPVLWVRSSYQPEIPAGQVEVQTLSADEIAAARAAMPGLVADYERTLREAKGQVAGLIHRVHDQLREAA